MTDFKELSEIAIMTSKAPIIAPVLGDSFRNVSCEGRHTQEQQLVGCRWHGSWINMEVKRNAVTRSLFLEGKF